MDNLDALHNDASNSASGSYDPIEEIYKAAGQSTASLKNEKPPVNLKLSLSEFVASFIIGSVLYAAFFFATERMIYVPNVFVVPARILFMAIDMSAPIVMVAMYILIGLYSKDSKKGWIYLFVGVSGAAFSFMFSWIYYLMGLSTARSLWQSIGALSPSGVAIYIVGGIIALFALYSMNLLDFIPKRRRISYSG